MTHQVEPSSVQSQDEPRRPAIQGPPIYDTCGDNFRVQIAGVDYTWQGHLGCVLYSHERGVKVGEVRVIGSVIFYARARSSRGWRRQVLWVPQTPVNLEWIRAFRSKLFDPAF